MALLLLLMAFTFSVLGLRNMPSDKYLLFSLSSALYSSPNFIYGRWAVSPQGDPVHQDGRRVLEFAAVRRGLFLELPTVGVRKKRNKKVVVSKSRK